MVKCERHSDWSKFSGLGKYLSRTSIPECGSVQLADFKKSCEKSKDGSAFEGRSTYFSLIISLPLQSESEKLLGVKFSPKEYAALLDTWVKPLMEKAFPGHDWVGFIHTKSLTPETKTGEHLHILLNPVNENGRYFIWDRDRSTFTKIREDIKSVFGEIGFQFQADRNLGRPHSEEKMRLHSVTNRERLSKFVTLNCSGANSLQEFKDKMKESGIQKVTLTKKNTLTFHYEEKRWSERRLHISDDVREKLSMMVEAEPLQRYLAKHTTERMPIKNVVFLGNVFDKFRRNTDVCKSSMIENNSATSELLEIIGITQNQLMKIRELLMFGNLSVDLLLRYFSIEMSLIKRLMKLADSKAKQEQRELRPQKSRGGIQL